MKSQIPKSILLILIYILFVLQIVFIGYCLVISGTGGALVLLSWIGNFLILFCLFTWKKAAGTLFTPYIIFLLSFYTFSFGQAFLLSIGMIHVPFNLYEKYSSKELLLAHYFTITGISFLHLGALWSQRKGKGFVKGRKDIRDINLKKSMKLVAWFLFFISAFFYFSDAFQNAVQSIKFGYMSLYNYDDRSMRETSFFENIIFTIKMFFVPSIFILLIVYKENTVMRRLIVSLIILAIILNFAAGTRTGAAALLISFILLWHEQMKPFKGTKFLKILIGAVFLLILFNVLGDIRGESDKDLQELFRTVVENISTQNPILQSVGEMGGSMFPLLEVMKLVPEHEDYRFGLTYLSSLFAIFPSFLIGDIIPRVSLSNWLMLTLNMDYGPGFSLLAEAYLNFSWFGVPFMFLLGYVLTRLLNPKETKSDYTIIRKILVYVFLYFIITAGRGDTLLIVRYQVFYVLIPFLMIYVVNRYKKK